MRGPHSTGLEGAALPGLPTPVPVSCCWTRGEINPGWANQIPSLGNLDLGHEAMDKREDLLKGCSLRGRGPHTVSLHEPSTSKERWTERLVC